MFLVDHDWLKKRAKGRKSWTGRRTAPSLYGLTGQGSEPLRSGPILNKANTIALHPYRKPSNKPIRQPSEQIAGPKESQCLQYRQQDEDTSSCDSRISETPYYTSPPRLYGSSVPGAPGFHLIRGLERYLAYYLNVISTYQHPLEETFKSGSNAIRAFWFPLAFEDDLWLQSVVLSAAAHHASVTFQPLPMRARQLMSTFLSQLNARIAEKTLTDGTIATISCLVLIEHDSCHYGVARLHAAGLAETIRIRGGLMTIQRERRAKLVRADIVRAVDALEHPLLTKLSIESSFQLEFNAELIANAAAIVARFQCLGVSPALLSTIWSISMLCQNLDLSWKKGDLLDPVSFYENTFRCCHDLLLFDSQTASDELVRIMLLSFMLPLYRQSPSINDKSSRLKGRLDSYLDTLKVVKIDHELKLWMLFVGYMASNNPIQHLHLRPRLREQLKILDIAPQDAWTQVRTHLQRCLWTEAIHDRFGEICYNLLSP